LRLAEIPKHAALAVIRGYKSAISPFFLPSCRYIPTCSEYAAEAVDRYGILRGSVMATARVLRCHPFSRGGFDPVPRAVEPGPQSRPNFSGSARERWMGQQGSRAPKGQHPSHPQPCTNH
jgi:putative membrane protein insertion efficiency factor